MAKINSSSKIQEVKGFGITGYSVEFSIKDLYVLDTLASSTIANSLNTSAPVLEDAVILAQTIHLLCERTLGIVDTRNNMSFDFLKNEEGAE